MKYLASILLFFSGIIYAQALVISEVMSNPVGDDSGREWIEIYNDTQSSVDLSTLTISIKGGNPIVVSPLSGGVSLPPNGYAIIGSVVSGATKFLQDYPSYTGVLLKGSISLVNTGTTSLEIRLGGVSSYSIPSYVAAKEGSTLALVGGSLVVSSPSPGVENQAPLSDSLSSSPSSVVSTSTTTDSQMVISQMSPPLADIILYMPQEKTVIAGAESIFSTSGMTRAGKAIDGLSCLWAFGDGGRALGTSTAYRYVYSGRYVAQVECSNTFLSGTGRVSIRVVNPDVTIKGLYFGKYGAYIDVANPNPYDLDFSQWKLSLDGALFTFPKNTLVAANSVTHFPALALGFGSTTVSTSTLVKILFPNLEEVTRYQIATSSSLQEVAKVTSLVLAGQLAIVESSKVGTFKSQVMATSKSLKKDSVAVVPTSTEERKGIFPAEVKKDKRIAHFIKSLFSK